MILLLGGNDRSLRLFSVVKESTSCEPTQGTFYFHNDIIVMSY